VIEALRAEHAEGSEGISLEELGKRVRTDFTDADTPWLYELVRGLTRDGLAMVAEDRPGYDASAVNEDEAGPDLSSIKVRLP
jgi:hypothetical protein